MSNALKATPTEYRGVRYRSKCEAMFARWLEVNGVLLAIGECGVIRASGFDYEPYGLAIDDVGGKPYLIDFLHWNVVSNLNDVATFVPIIHYSFIEYKPSKPTRTYIDSLGKKFDRIKQLYTFLVSANFYCFYGSVFNESRGIFVYTDGEWTRTDVDWLSGSKDDLLSTRFDLEGA